MTAFAVTNHQCQLYVSGILCIYRAVVLVRQEEGEVVPINRVSVRLQTGDGAVTFYCDLVDDKIIIYPKLLRHQSFNMRIDLRTEHSGLEVSILPCQSAQQ